MKYRKKPVVIEAMQWRPDDLGLAGPLVGWLLRHEVNFRHQSGSGDTTTVDIETLEGTMTALPGDWIIKGIKGEFYPCKPDIFEASYEPVIE